MTWLNEQNWTHRIVPVNDVQLHVVEAGDGPLIVLLHGFPEYWRSWRHQIGVLADAGFYVIAPDMRGYNLSSKPRGISSYRLELLSADVAQLVQQSGAQKAVIVGHDWGGVIAWDVAMQYPALVDKLVILNAPHPALIPREMRQFGQLMRSWYIFFFQLPWLPELLLRSRHFAALRSVLHHDPVRRKTFTRRDIRGYVEALSQPGALMAGINYYRAALRYASRSRRRVRRIKTPTLLIWGERDRYLNTGYTKGLERLVPDLHIRCIADASHWVQNDAPEYVNDLMLWFLTASGIKN